MENTNLKDDTIKSLDDITAWLSDAKSSEYGFIKAAYRAMDQFQQGNRDPLAKLLTVVNGKKAKRVKNVEGNKLVFASALKRIVQHVLPNVKAKYNAGADFGVAWTLEKGANNFVDEEKLSLLHRYASLDREEAISPFGKDFKEAFPAIKKEAPAKSNAELIEAKKASILKWLEENDIPASVFAHALTAKATNKVDDEPAH